MNLNGIASKALRGLWIQNKLFFSTRAGSLYTWGLYSLGSGIDQESQNDQLVPRRVETFYKNVVKVASGPFATAIVTDSGELFTTGENQHGQLGIGTKENSLTPAKVNFFRERGLKVRDVAVGDKHMCAVTEDGSVWTWGSHGCSWLKSLMGFAGPLGGDFNTDQLVPVQVESLKNVKFSSVTCGNQFVQLLAENGDIYQWGNGRGGKFGDGVLGNQLVYPEKNAFFDAVKNNGLSITKIKTANEGTVALLSDGTLYGWGRNFRGQLGVREQDYVRTDWEVPVPLPVNMVYAKQGEKVTDFDLGVNTLVFITDQNNVYFSGTLITWVPVLLKSATEGEKFVKVVASDNSVAILNDKGDLYVTNSFIEPVEKKNEQFVFKIPSDQVFGGKKVLDIGGSYGVRYAVIDDQ